ncbi:UPF0348 protein family [Sporolactobacillus inulinus]|uniref:tRNA(Met) cytidine acetate ligase n=1 Tax=Sporolactobacillus inulinus TaxID=2078 RepID=A0A4Y1ZBS0_9BACL|nr:nucleotidyltransferase [Sporolactobacillus inulinus]GAY76454.1 UPF0348 protein family [Sporolactobacillus inulinus]
MIIAGIIAEYNPFHNGHRYQLDTLKKQLHPDLVIVVMSGDFVQRGEPALVSKWRRTQMALQAGADLIVELPYIYAVAKADVFARGAVAIMDRLGVNALFFSSENGKIAPFMNTLSLIEHHQADYDTKLNESMKRGLSYPNAHAAAYRAIAADKSIDLVDLAEPNNSLGFQYIKAIRQRNSPIIPYTIPRRHAQHNDQSWDQENTIASESSIRSHLQQQSIQSMSNKVPDFVADRLELAHREQAYGTWELFFPYLKYKLISSSKERLHAIYEMEEGIEHRLQSQIRHAHSFQAFISAVKTKRYTWARLQRLSAHILTDTLKKQAIPLALESEPDAIRLLGMNGVGQAYLAKIRKKITVPILSKIRNHRSEMVELDLKAAQIYDFLTIKDQTKTTYSETGHPPFRYDEKTGRFLNE